VLVDAGTLLTMTNEPTDADATLATLDALPTEELRERAFKLAWEHHDIGFFVRIIRSLPHAEGAEDVDGSLGSFGAELSDVYSMWREFTGHGYGEEEPLIRAAFIDYLMKN
jgi:hypothetical protein